MTVGGTEGLTPGGQVSEVAADVGADPPLDAAPIGIAEYQVQIVVVVHVGQEGVAVAVVGLQPAIATDEGAITVADVHLNVGVVAVVRDVDDIVVTVIVQVAYQPGVDVVGVAQASHGVATVGQLEADAVPRTGVVVGFDGEGVGTGVCGDGEQVNGVNVGGAGGDFGIVGRRTAGPEVV